MKPVVLFALLLAACDSSRSGFQSTPTAPIDAGPTDAATAFVPEDLTPGACYDPAVTETVTPGASTVEACAVWNSLSQMMGEVTISNAQSMLTMSFGGTVVFTGSDSNGTVSLVYTHLHSFSDGCEWRATETLTGTLAPSTCVLELSYTYNESVEVSNGACDTPCTANGTFTFAVTPIS